MSSSIPLVLHEWGPASLNQPCMSACLCVWLFAGARWRHTCRVSCSTAGFNSDGVINSEKGFSPKHKYWHTFGTLLSSPTYCELGMNAASFHLSSTSIYCMFTDKGILYSWYTGNTCKRCSLFMCKLWGPLLILNIHTGHTILSSYPCMTSWDGVSFWYSSETFPSPEEPKAYNRSEIYYHIAVPSDTALVCLTFTLRTTDIGWYFSLYIVDFRACIIWFETDERGNQYRILLE